MEKIMKGMKICLAVLTGLSLLACERVLDPMPNGHYTDDNLSDYPSKLRGFVDKAFSLANTSTYNTNEYIYLVGRYDGGSYSTALAGGTTNAPGFTMVANPTMAGIADLNDLVFTDGSGNAADPAADDRIVIQDAAGFQKVYVRNAANTEWGRWVSRKSETTGLVTQEWVNNDGIVPSGTGFWYVRTADSSLTIQFGGAQ